MTRVYVLQHEHETDNGGDAKLIGVYGSEREAAEALARARQRPGFVEHPDGFSIDAYDLGRDHWVDGFVTVDRSGSAGASKGRHAA